MSVIAVTKDFDALTLTVTADFPASVERIWQLWADPRQFERWWGPPGWPATVTEHDLRPDGTVRYHMTGPDGEVSQGHWTVRKVDPPHRLVVEDSFADESGTPNPDMPTVTMDVSIETLDDRHTRMTTLSRYGSLEALEMVLEMGMEEGVRAALGQIDDILDDAG